MGNTASSSKPTTEPRKVGIASHPYQQRHPYNLDDYDEASIYTENYDEHYNDELLEPRQLKNMFSNEGRDSSTSRKCRQKQGSRRAGEVFEPIIRNHTHRFSSSQKKYDNLGRYCEDHDQIESCHGKQASKKTILKALQQKMTAQSDLGHRNIFTKSSTDSDESNGSALSFREVMQLSATNDNTLKGDEFHTYGKQLSTIMDVSEYSNTIVDDTLNEESYILSEHEKTCFSSDQKVNESVESNTSEQEVLDHDLSDYTDRMISFLDKKHASYNQDVEKIADIKTPNQNLGNLFADMTLDQSSKYIVFDDALTKKEQDDEQDLDETTNGTWDEFDDSSSKLFEKSPKTNNNEEQALNDCKVCDRVDQHESYGKKDDDQSTSRDEELSSIETSVMESSSLNLSEITSTKMSMKEEMNGKSQATPNEEYLTKKETRDPSPVPIVRSLKAPTTSNLVNLLPSFSNNDVSCDSSAFSKKQEISMSAKKKENDIKNCSHKKRGPDIGAYIEIDDDMTQVSTITMAPVLDACAVIKNHAKPAFSKQAISNAAFLFSDESVPLHRRTLCPSKIDVQRLSLLDIDPINDQLTKHSLPMNHFNRGDLTHPNEAPVDMVRRLSRESFNGRTWTKEISSSAVIIKRSNGYVQINSQGSMFTIPEEKSPVKLGVMSNENNVSKLINLTKGDKDSDQSTTPNKNISGLKLKEECDSISETIDNDILAADFQKRYSAITPMKTKSPYVRFKKALRMFGGEINKNDRFQDLKPTLEKKSDVDSTRDTLSSVGSNSDDNSSHSPGLSVRSSSISITNSSVDDVFADLLNCSSPESANCNMYLPQQLQSAMKKPNHVRENSTNRVSWVVASSGDASDIFRVRESSITTASPNVDSSVADSLSAISITPPPPVASSSRTFRSVVNPRMMFQSSQAQSKVIIAENDENSSKNSYCSYSPLQSHSENKAIEKTVPKSRSALCLSPLQKTPSQSRKWRNSTTENYVNGNDKGGNKRQKNFTKRTPFANLRNANII